MITINPVVYEQLVSLLNQVPDIVYLYEMKRSTFIIAVKEWFKNLERILKSNRIHTISEISTFKAMVIAAQRGFYKKDMVIETKNHVTNRQLTDFVGLYSLQGAQHSVQLMINPVEKRYEEAIILSRKILLTANSLGLLNKRLRTSFDPDTTIQSLWKDMISNENTSPLTTQLLEIVNIDEAFTIIEKVLDQWIKNF
jgi:hypothetical protein